MYNFDVGLICSLHSTVEMKENAIASMQKVSAKKVARKYPPDQHMLHKTARYKKLLVLTFVFILL